MLTLLSVFGPAVHRHLNKYKIYEPKCDGTLNEYDSFGTKIPKSEFPSFDTVKLPVLPFTLKDVTVTGSQAVTVEKPGSSATMATIHDTRVARFIPISGAGSTGSIGLKDLGAKPKKMVNGDLTRQASPASDTVVGTSYDSRSKKSPKRDARMTRMVHFADGSIPGDAFYQETGTQLKTKEVDNVSCETSTQNTKIQLKMDDRMPKLIPFASNIYPVYNAGEASHVKPKENTDDNTAPPESKPQDLLYDYKEYATQGEVTWEQGHKQPTIDVLKQEAKEHIKNENEQQARERYVGRAYNNSGLNFYLNPPDYDKPRDWEKKRNPRSVEEFFSTNRDFKESLAFCLPPPQRKHVFSREPYSFRDPYRTDHFSAHDWAEYHTWERYEMDYMGRHSSDNIINKINQTLAHNAHHPHTYLPYNHSEDWWTVRTRDNMDSGQGATANVEAVQGTSGSSENNTRERSHRLSPRGDK